MVSFFILAYPVILHPKTLRKNVTVPEYLVVLGKKKHLNFSAVLTEALKNKLEM